jgi:hypothetical protein
MSSASRSVTRTLTSSSTVAAGRAQIGGRLDSADLVNGRAQRALNSRQSVSTGRESSRRGAQYPAHTQRSTQRAIARAEQKKMRGGISVLTGQMECFVYTYV